MHHINYVERLARSRDLQNVYQNKHCGKQCGTGGPVLGPYFGRLTFDCVIALVEIAVRAVERARVIVFHPLHMYRYTECLPKNRETRLSITYVL